MTPSVNARRTVTDNHQEKPMSTLDQAREAIRTFATFGEYATAYAAATAQERAALAAAARESVTLAYTGGTTDDLAGWLRNGWAGQIVGVLAAARPLTEFFGTLPLPDQGNKVEIGVDRTEDAAAGGFQVGEQTAEGEAVPGGLVKIGTELVPVHTLSGATPMSIQELTRSGPLFGQAASSIMARRYGIASEAVTRATVLDSANATALAGTGTSTVTTLPGFQAFVADAAAQIQDAGGTGEGIILGYDLLKTLGALQAEAAGTMDLSALVHDVAPNARIIPTNTGATANFVRVASRQAIQTMESEGAPFQLADTHAASMTGDLGIYGYFAAGPAAPALMIAPDTTA